MSNDCSPFLPSLLCRRQANRNVTGDITSAGRMADRRSPAATPSTACLHARRRQSRRRGWKTPRAPGNWEKADFTPAAEDEPDVLVPGGRPPDAPAAPIRPGATPSGGAAASSDYWRTGGPERRAQSSLGPRIGALPVTPRATTAGGGA